MNQVILRDDQKELKLKIYQDWYVGILRVLAFMPTGGGKTVIAGSIINDAVRKDKRVLFLVHREKLLKQTGNSLKKFYDLNSGFIWGDLPLELDKNIQISMLQTLSNRDLSDYGEFDLIVIDECHNTSHFNVFRRILDHNTQDSKGIWDLSKLRVLGLSATPYRSNPKEGFCVYFQSHVESLLEKELVEMGEKKRPRVFGFGSIDYDSVGGENHDEYSSEDLKLVCNGELNNIAIQSFLDICKDRKVIFFCGRIDQAEDLNLKLNSIGIKSACVTSNTKNRESIFKKYNIDELQSLVSVGALNEGFDETSINCVALVRPMKSIALLKQSIGRGGRKHKGLEDFIILDLGDSIEKVLGGDPLKHIDIELCPKHKPKKDDEKPSKTCPECDHKHLPFLKICPECGYEYPSHESILFIPGELVEKYDYETLPKVKYLRSEMKKAYTRKSNPAKVRYNFYKKFGNFPADAWLFGAIFGSKNPGSNQLIYRQHLNEVLVNPKPRDIEFWLRCEFKKNSDYNLYLPPDKYSDPYQILGVSSNVIDERNFTELHKCYNRKLGLLTQEFESEMYDENTYNLYMQCVEQAFIMVSNQFRTHNDVMQNVI